MIATILLSIGIFGSAAWVLYRQFRHPGCEDCQKECIVKDIQESHNPSHLS